VLLPDGTNVNHALVSDGWYWWYRKYAPENRKLERLETEAREAKNGLWADPQPVPPWEWRKRKERCNTAPSAAIHAVNAIVNEGLNRDLIGFRLSAVGLVRRFRSGRSSVLEQWAHLRGIPETTLSRSIQEGCARPRIGRTRYGR